jgi:hypothetical protein
MADRFPAIILRFGLRFALRFGIRHLAGWRLNSPLQNDENRLFRYIIAACSN